MSRRGKGEGSTPAQRKDGLWSAYVTLGYVNGKPKRQYVYAKTRRECSEKLKGILGKSSSAVLPNAQAVSMLVWLEQFITEKKSARADGTITQWGYCLKRVKPYLEHLSLSRVTPTSIRFALSHITHLAGSTQQNTFDFISAALNDAVKLGMISKNPCDALERPKATQVKTRKVLHQDQLLKLLDVSQGHNLETLIRLGYSYGLRIGEILALRWSDWDTTTNRLMVRHSLERKSGLHLRPAKSNSSGAMILDPVTAQSLEQQRQKNQTRALELEPLGAWSEHDLIFPSCVGTPLEYHNVVRSLQTLFAKAGIPYANTHTMRRTYISMALQHLNPREVADVVRHKSTRMTMDIYAQTLQSASPRAAISLENLLHPNYTLSSKLPRPKRNEKGKPVVQPLVIRIEKGEVHHGKI
jgi:integrase